MSLYPAFERGRIDGAALAGNFTPVAENGQSWNAANVEAGGQLLLAFGIDLGQAGGRLQFPGGAGEGWRHAATGAAPRRPEVDDNRQIATPDMAVDDGTTRWVNIGKAFDMSEFKLASSESGLTSGLTVLNLPATINSGTAIPVWFKATNTDAYLRSDATDPIIRIQINKVTEKAV